MLQALQPSLLGQPKNHLTNACAIPLAHCIFHLVFFTQPTKPGKFGGFRWWCGFTLGAGQLVKVQFLFGSILCFFLLTAHGFFILCGCRGLNRWWWCLEGLTILPMGHHGFHLFLQPLVCLAMEVKTQIRLKKGHHHECCNGKPCASFSNFKIRNRFLSVHSSDTVIHLQVYSCTCIPMMPPATLQSSLLVGPGLVQILLRALLVVPLACP